MASTEVILSACSSPVSAGSASTSTSTGKTTFTPSIQLHDLSTSSHLQSYKPSTSAAHTLAYAPSVPGRGGTLWAVQESKAIAGVWAFQRDQQIGKVHLPERLSCLAISPNGVWIAGGGAGGQVYLWEISSGLMLASFTAHYRTVRTLTFSPDSTLLVSSSADGPVHVYLVSRLIDADAGSSSAPGVPYGKPYGVLSDHTLGVTAVALGRTAGCAGGRCWTAAEDGTIKMWSLHPPFDLLTTFSLPPSATPTTLAVDPSERFLYTGTAEGAVYLLPLFKRRSEHGGSQAPQISAVGGLGPSAPPIPASHALAALTVSSPITALALSLSADHLLVGTLAGEIHIHALPSHQHVRTIGAHAGVGPVSHLSTMPRPADLPSSAGSASNSGSSAASGAASKDDYPVLEVKPLERMRAGRSVKDAHDVSVALGSSAIRSAKVDGLRSSASRAARASAGSGAGPRTVAGTAAGADEESPAALRDEIRTLRAALEKAHRINEKMWHGVVDMKMGGV